MFSKTVVAAASVAMFSLATAQVTSVSPSQSSKIEADLYLYASSLGGSPQFTSNAEEFATGVPSAQLASIASASTPLLSTSVDYLSVATAPPSISFPPWVTEIPQNIASDFKAFATSLQLAQISVVRSDLGFTGALAAATSTAATVTPKTGAAAPAKPVLLGAAGLAAGAMGIAAVVL